MCVWCELLIDQSLPGVVSTPAAKAPTLEGCSGAMRLSWATAVEAFTLEPLWVGATVGSAIAVADSVPG
jgi:hypothetical protein